ncbi:MAG: DegT/DnrJ/EryC1/StrS family aminotransferase [Proteobacteria bacterium]|nr:DegT/DnrJ/EryC1/StrS family aminotransferase [Pseudomonadota bacterium]
MTQAVPVARPWMGEEEVAAVQRVILSGWVAQGPEVEAFEREFASWVGAAHACAVGNGTAALHLALLALDVGPGDEVVTVSHSFIATANAVRLAGAVPVFVDVDAGTGNIEPGEAATVLTKRTKAILAVHQIGVPCDMEALLSIAEPRGIPIVEDAACAIGSEIRIGNLWERIGRPHGRIACFSFHPRKLLTTGEGGMITTADDRLDARLRSLRSHGVATAIESGGNARTRQERYQEVGLNARLTDIQAAVGRVQLRRLEVVLAERRRLAARYNALLNGIAGLELPKEPDWLRSNVQSYCVRLPPDAEPRGVMERLAEAGIACRPGIANAHREPAYRSGGWRCADGPGRCGCASGSCARLATSEMLQDRGLILPLFHGLSDDDQARVVSALAAALGG